MLYCTYRFTVPFYSFDWVVTSLFGHLTLPTTEGLQVAVSYNNYKLTLAMPLKEPLLN